MKKALEVVSDFRFITLAVAGTLAIAAGALPSAAIAADAGDTAWQKSHPRREQVNQRLHRQNERIKTEVKEGELTKDQAATLHKQDHQIRSEERMMASQNNGHITKQEQAALNQQLNAVSKQIGE